MITYYPDIEQGSPEWLAIRCGLLTASEMKHIITPGNLAERGHLYELVAQRINKYVEPSYMNDDMLRGVNDEIEAKIIYNEQREQVKDIGFITNDAFGYTLGYSPDGLIGDDGAIEIKSKKQKLQCEVILHNQVPVEHIIQLQTGLLVSERKWVDFISYCGGMPLFIKRVYPDKVIQSAIIQAANIFENKAKKLIEMYNEMVEGMIMTERKIITEIVI